MSELTKRTIFGALFVIVVVGSVLLNPPVFGSIFLIFCVLAVRELMVMYNADKPNTIAAMIGGGWLFASFFLMFSDYLGTAAGVLTFVLYIMYILCLMVAQMWMKKAEPLRNWGLILLSQLWVALPFALMCFIYYLDSVHRIFDKHLLLCLFITVWVNDTGAYVVGSLTAKLPRGNHKMTHISPKKSWEGLVGGILFSLAAGVIYYYVGWMHSLPVSLVGTAAIAVSATFGDLMESFVKRSVGIKDSGVFLPGHGGVLDRFDSLLLATPVFIIVYLLLYVGKYAFAA